MENRCHNKKNIGCYDYEKTIMCSTQYDDVMAI